MLSLLIFQKLTLRFLPLPILLLFVFLKIRLHDIRLSGMRAHSSTVATFTGAEADIEDVRLFGSSGLVASASRDAFCRIHDTRSPGAPVMTTSPPENHGYSSLDFSPDGRWLFAACSIPSWHVLDAFNGQRVAAVEAPAGQALGPITKIRSAPDGRVVTGGDDHQVLVWNVRRPEF